MKKDQSDYRQLFNRHAMAWPVEITAVYTLFTKACPEPFYFSGELHDPWELVYMIQGEMDVTADERVYRLRPGDMIFHKPLEMHKISASQPRTQYFVMSFDLSGPRAGDFRGKVFHLKREEQDMMAGTLALLDALNTPIDDRGFHYYHTVWEKQALPLHEACSRMQTLLLKMLSAAPAPSPAGMSPRAGLYTRIVRILEAEANAQLSIAQIAARCHAGTATVKKCFAEYAGCGVHKYALRIRLRRAVDLLRSGLSVSETSERTGFCNPNYFSAVFRRELGHSPSYYRQG